MSTPLFDLPERQMADASLEAYAHISETLQEREIEMFVKVSDYLDRTGYADVTGGELSQATGIPVTSIRPRLTGLMDKGWLQAGAIRSSRAPGEKRCHPVWLNVPRAAIERLKR